MMYLVVCWVDVYVELSIWKRWLSSWGVFQVDVLLQERCLLIWGVCLYEVSASKGQGFHPGMLWFRLSFSHGRDPNSGDVFTNNQIIKKMSCMWLRCWICIQFLKVSVYIEFCQQVIDCIWLTHPILQKKKKDNFSSSIPKQYL